MIHNFLYNILIITSTNSYHQGIHSQKINLNELLDIMYEYFRHDEIRICDCIHISRAWTLQYNEIYLYVNTRRILSNKIFLT